MSDYRYAPFTREDLDSALDQHRLECRWNNGRWYACRRNGATRTWKRDPARFRIPCKTGFRDCFAIATRWHDGDLMLDSDRLRIIV